MASPVSRPSKILIVYGTREGQTRKIGEYIAKELKTLGHDITLVDSEAELENGAHNVTMNGHNVDPRTYDATVVGGSVHMSYFPKNLIGWVGHHGPHMSQQPSAFFSVCLGINDKSNNAQKSREYEEKLVTEFLKQSRWEPRFYDIFAGALQYTQYNWFMQRVMRYISGHSGGDTDMNKDYEYTNWDQVRDFAHRFHDILTSQVTPKST